ncbi:RibD family protein [Umezawaea tangerina]|uniref:Riboflavin biosynthesis pyrimidine reductase n=1 Tax=Umezawaea tangerina TaxID=84725 RepID=A0A2T0SQI1_9PSEU|nr:dihydrofolate reductase family protein [Umezawaea tangerina]PRY35671.1 riboflavin biosynthesis pyrimidine reductase [Umezawaea tangerina]
MTTNLDQGASLCLSSPSSADGGQSGRSPVGDPGRQTGLVAAADSPSRPRVVVSVVATADGRVALNRAERLLDEAVNRRWSGAWPADAAQLVAARSAAIERRHHPTVVLEGSGTFVGDHEEPPPLPSTTAPAAELRTDFLPFRTPRWFVVVDGRGRMRWTRKGDAETSLLVLVCGSTPLPYLAYLRAERIPYLVAGTARVDLAAALGRLRSELGAGCVVSQAGGGLNGALLRAGLVDELHVVTIPALVGGLGTPSVVDGPPLALGEAPVRLRTVDVVVGDHGTVWAHYEVSG